MTIELRALDKADIPAVAALYTAAEVVDDTGEHYSEADVEEEFANPEIELGKDVVGAFDGDELVGCFSVMARRDEDDRKANAFGLTRPDRRGEGIGTLLVTAMLARARELQRVSGASLRLLTTGRADQADQAALLASVGMVPERWSFGMRAALGDVPVPAGLPAGYAVRPYQPDDSDRWMAAHNVAFLDHPNFSVWVASEWQHWVAGNRSFRPELSFLVSPEGRPDVIAAYVQTNEYDAVQEVTGRREAYVAKVGTVPDHRGKGLASALLRHCLVAYQDAGYDDAALDVDSMNPSGALGIYERAGFEVERRFTTYSRVIG
jgi:mycothiol synthase